MTGALAPFSYLVFNVFDETIRFAMALALGSGLEPKINETTKDSSNVLIRLTSDVVKQVTFDADVLDKLERFHFNRFCAKHQTCCDNCVAS